MINLTLSTYNLLSQLQDTFTIDQLTDNATVSVIINNEDVYSTTLAQHNGMVKFYGLCDIIARHMENLELPTPAVSFKVRVVSGNTTLQTDEVYVIYDSYKPANTTAKDFIDAHFLTSRSYIEVPRSAPCVIYMMVTQSGFTPFIEALFKQHGETATVRVTLEQITAQAPCIVSLDIAPATVKLLADQQQETDCGTIISYSIYAGERRMSVFVRKENPEIIFNFRNAFNVTEQAYIYGSSKLITAIERKEAVCMKRKTFYDESVTRKHEVTTEALSLETANWLNELFISKIITTKVGDNLEAVVLISDITSEISDSQEDVNRHKFSWEFDDNAQWIHTGNQDRIFTQQYLPVFN